MRSTVIICNSQLLFLAKGYFSQRTELHVSSRQILPSELVGAVVLYHMNLNLTFIISNRKCHEYCIISIAKSKVPLLRLLRAIYFLVLFFHNPP